jgi:O-antigen/teichoic acid export membrane protein
MVSLTRRILEGTFVISLGNILMAFFGFLTSILLIRVLGRYEFGLLTLTLSAFNIGVIFLDLGIGPVLIADVAKELGNRRVDRAKSLLYRYIQIESLLGSVLFLAVFLSANFFAVKYNETVGTLIRMSAFLLILAGLKNILIVMFNSHSKFDYFSFMQIIDSASRLLFVFLLIVVIGKGLIGAMFAYLLSYFTSSVLSFPLFVKTGGYLTKVEKARENLFVNTIKGHGKYGILMRQFRTFNLNVPPWIIRHFLGVETVGIFSAAWKLQGFFVGLLHPLEQVLMPIISEISASGKEKIKLLHNKSVKYSLFLSLIILIGVELFAPLLIKNLFTSKYLASVPVFRILMLLLLVSAFNIPLRPIFFTYKAQKYLFLIYVVSTLILFLIGSVLTSILGIIGMAIGMVLSGGVGVLIRYTYAKKLFGIKMEARALFEFDEYDRRMAGKIKEKIGSFL